MHRLLALLVFAFGWSATIASAQATRTWTDSTGQTVTAKFVSVTSTTVTLNQDGKVLRVPRGKFSEADREWINRASELRRVRTWTVDGQRLRAKYDGLVDGKVQLKAGDDEHDLALADLAAEDRALVESYEGLGTAEGDLASPSGGGTAPASGVERTWTNSAGKSIVAEYRGVEADRVLLRMDGKEFRVPLATLSVADQQFIADQRSQALRPTAPSTPDVLAQPVAPPATPLDADTERAQRQAEITARAAQIRAEMEARRAAAAANPQPPEEVTPEPPSNDYVAHEPSIPGPSHEWQPPTRPETPAYEPPPSPTMVPRDYVITCPYCNHKNSSPFHAGDKCRKCKRRIEVIAESGKIVEQTTSSQVRSYRGVIKLAVLLVVMGGSALGLWGKKS